MRRVKFRRWIPRQLERLEGNTYDTVVKGTSKYEDDFNGVGLFHQWGQEGDQDGNYPVGIVELEDGSIVSIKSDYIRFLASPDAVITWLGK